MVALASALVIAGAAHADRKPTPDERSRTETRLRELGYTSWVDIEVEDNGRVVEIEGARHASGRRHDLKLRWDSLEVISRKSD
jgi:hypothetical protein